MEETILKEFEKYKGYSQESFDFEDEREFELFKEGFICCWNLFAETGNDLPNIF